MTFETFGGRRVVAFGIYVVFVAINSMFLKIPQETFLQVTGTLITLITGLTLTDIAEVKKK